MGAGSYSINTTFRAKDSVTPVFDSMTRGAGRFENRLTRIQRGAAGFGSCLTGTFKRIGGAIAAVAGFEILRQGVQKINEFADSASDLQETLGKTGEVFKTHSSELENWAKGSIKNMGLSQQAALDTASLYGDMGTGMGMSTKRAAEMSMSLTQLSADLASFKNIEQEVAASALKGIFTGETEALKNLGTVMNETTLQEYAKTIGIRKKLKDMSQTEKIELRYKFVMKSTSNSQGDFLRTLGGYANQKRVGENLNEQARTDIGNIFLPDLNRIMLMKNKILANNLDKIIGKFSRFYNFTKKTILRFKPVFDDLKNNFLIFKDYIIASIDKVGPGAKDVFDNILIPGFKLVLEAVVKLLPIAGALILGFSNVCSFIKDNFVPISSMLGAVLTSAIILNFRAIQYEAYCMGIRILEGAKSFIVLMGSVARASYAFACSPIGAITLAIVGLIAVVTLLWKNWDKVTETLTKWWGLIKSGAQTAVPIVKEAFFKMGTYIKDYFINVLLNALGPLSLLFRGTKRLIDLIREKRSAEEDGGLNEFMPGTKGNKSLLPQDSYTSNAFGTVTVMTQIDNNTPYAASSSAKVKENHGMSLAVE